MKLPGEQLVLDTNIFVYWIRGSEVGVQLRAEYDLGNRRPRPIIPVVVVGEIRAFARSRAWGTKKLEMLDELLKNFPHADISSEAVIDAYVELDCESHASGRRMGKNDLWVAAIARVQSAVVLTTDADFDHLHPKLVRIERFVVPAAQGAT